MGCFNREKDQRHEISEPNINRDTLGGLESDVNVSGLVAGWGILVLVGFHGHSKSNMAASPKPEPTGVTTAGRGDKITTMLMMAAALTAVGGFAILFSLWWRSGVTDPYEILRVAAQEFVAGRPIVAGELAETVRFDNEPAAASGNAEEALPPEGEPPLDVPGEPEPEAGDEDQSPEEKSAADKAKKLKEWIRLGHFLVVPERSPKHARRLEFGSDEPN